MENAIWWAMPTLRCANGYLGDEGDEGGVQWMRHMKRWNNLNKFDKNYI